MKVDSIDVCVPSLSPLNVEFTDRICKLLPVHHLLTSNLKGRGLARQELIKHVDTEWFVFIDTDVRIKDGFWKTMKSYIEHDDDGIGAVEGLGSYPLDDRLDKIDKSMSRIAQILHRPDPSEIVTKGFTGDTIIRTSLVKDINIPNINVWEDEWIRLHIKKRGKSWIRTREVVCEHERTYNIGEAYESGRYRYAFGRFSPIREISNLLFKLPLRVVFALFGSGSYSAARLILDIQLADFKGAIHAHAQGFAPFQDEVFSA